MFRVKYIQLKNLVEGFLELINQGINMKFLKTLKLNFEQPYYYVVFHKHTFTVVAIFYYESDAKKMCSKSSYYKYEECTIES